MIERTRPVDGGRPRVNGNRSRSIEGLRRITIHQGETRVSDDPGVVLATLLGSCIAACLHDPIAKVGGINHFLLAEPGSGHVDPDELQRYGVHAMEVLINAMLAMGATRLNLKARLYGGASLRDRFIDIGAANTLFARRFLRDEGIMLVGEDVGGSSARRVEFRPTLGLARCRTATKCLPERRLSSAFMPSAATSGEVEFF